MERSLEVLGTRFVVDCDAPELIEAFFSVFSGFARSRKRRSAASEIRVTISQADGEYVTADRTVPLVEGRLRPIQVFNLLYSTVLRSVEGVFLLHAAAVERDGQALLIAGPGGAGKTSLARALVARGFRLLSDDIAPLSISDGRVHPFPRRIGLTSGDLGSMEVPGNAIRLSGKVFTTPESLGLRPFNEAARPVIVALVNPYRNPGGITRIRLGLLGDPEAFVARLESVAGARVTSSAQSAGVTTLRLELVGGQAAMATELAILDAQSDLLFQDREHGPEKDYAERPSLEPVTVREAAVELLREVLNRDPASALIRELRGSVTGGMFELAGLFTGVDCYRLIQSDVETTADLLAEAFNECRVATG